MIARVGPKPFQNVCDYFPLDPISSTQKMNKLQPQSFPFLGSA
jgi:hypothetical protein